MNPVRGEYGLEKFSPAETREPGSSDVVSIRELRAFAVERPNGCLDPEQRTIVRSVAAMNHRTCPVLQLR